MQNVNRQWRLKSRPQGMPVAENWELVEGPVPDPGEGQIVARACWLSVDPYMRGRISAAQSYAKPVDPGDVMQGGGVGVVVRSRNPAFKPGDIVESMGWGWQDYATLGSQGTRKVDPALGPMRHALGVLGMPGLTAYFAFLDVGAPRVGDTVVVSSAAGAVGQVVGQIAKLMGCRAVAIAGSAVKLAWCRELGYDAGVDYKSGDLRAALAAATADGVDVYFDNTAGPIFDAVMERINLRGRIVQCGTIDTYNRAGQPDMGLRHHRHILVKRLRWQGFLYTDYVHRADEGLARLSAWVRDGRIRYREDIADGIERMPEAFLRLLTGENLGKQLVRIAPEPA
ncbi:MAG: NADP-dependent oxidoreductase [Alphaproteobacteria bacterium]|nr:NADP-dependent oxidoreductase [Alphaproteobacteria bacterium]